MPDTEELPRKLPHSSPDSEAEAREQAAEYDGLFGDTDLPLDSGPPIKVPPHPDYGMLGDEQCDAYDELLFERDTLYERHEDIFIPEQRLRDAKGVETGVVLPAQTQQGAIKVPYRILGGDGKPVLVKPSWNVRVVQIALGETEYKRLIDGGRSPADVWRVWGKQSMRIQERQKRDSKSDARDVPVAAVS